MLPAANATTQTILPIYLCPSDPVENNPNVNFQNYGKSNYVASAGVIDGVGSGRDRTRLQTIQDGTSNTFMVAERDSRLGIAGIWPGRTTQTGGSNGFVANWRPNLRFPGNRGSSCCGENTNSMTGEIRRWVIDGPAACGLDRASWTHEELADHLLKTHGIKASRSAMHRFCAKIAIRPYRPTYRFPGGDAAKQEAAKEDLAALKKSAGGRPGAAEPG